jgi:hypothetical protein
MRGSSDLVPEVLRRADGREDGGEEVQAHGELGDVRVVRVLARAARLLRVVPQVRQEQPHHAALALRPHHHLRTRTSYCIFHYLYRNTALKLSRDR